MEKDAVVFSFWTIFLGRFVAYILNLNPQLG